jgi:hypothetical protein
MTNIDYILGSKKLSPKNLEWLNELLMCSRHGRGTVVSFRWQEDGSLLAEWVCLGNHRRLGFSFEPEEEQSSWYIASSPISKVDGSGYLRDKAPSAVLLQGL